MFKEFYPSILFLVKFFVLYMIMNFSYGLYIESFMPLADPVTHWVTDQSGFLLRLLGFDVSSIPSLNNHFVHLKNSEKSVLAVFEGCNGINIMIIFIAFLLSFGKLKKMLWWYIPIGLIIIYVSNLLRIAGLYFVSEYLPQFQYFFHKYLFTGVLFVIIFGIWFWYVRLYTFTTKKQMEDVQ